MLANLKVHVLSARFARSLICIAVQLQSLPLPGQSHAHLLLLFLPALILTSKCWPGPAGASTTLTLKLVAPVEPQYGPDFKALTVLLEPQTPQRLHVKISPAADSTAGEDEGVGRQQAPRWEVPEWLLTRFDV
jgi:hypothetical protein